MMILSALVNLIILMSTTDTEEYFIYMLYICIKCNDDFICPSQSDNIDVNYRY